MVYKLDMISKIFARRITILNDALCNCVLYSKAAKMLKATLDWHEQINIQSLRVSEFDTELRSGKMYIQGNSESGKSILVS